MPKPPLARVTVDLVSKTIEVNPDRLLVEQGSFVLNWLKETPTAGWSFVDLTFKTPPPSGCFSHKTVNASLINVVDNNVGDECAGTFRYSLTVRNDGTGEEFSNDPEIENKPTGN